LTSPANRAAQMRMESTFITKPKLDGIRDVAFTLTSDGYARNTYSAREHATRVAKIVLVVGFLSDSCGCWKQWLPNERKTGPNMGPTMTSLPVLCDRDTLTNLRG
jgi:hypothetical protein